MYDDVFFTDYELCASYQYTDLESTDSEACKKKEKTGKLIL